MTADDTLDTSPQDQEWSKVAMALAGMLPGVRAMTPDDLGDDGALVMYQVPRDELTAKGAADVAGMLSRLGQRGHAGRVLLFFDGWANDPRALCQVPQVVQFCARVLLGKHATTTDWPAAPPQACLDHARLVLAALMDERMMWQDLGMPDDGGVPGRAFLVAHAFASHCFDGPTARWAGVNYHLLDVLTQPPGPGAAPMLPVPGRIVRGSS